MPKPELRQPSAHAPLPVAVLDDAQRLACLRLVRSENVGPVTFRALINHYGGAAQALAALPELARRGGRGRPSRICSAAAAEEELAAAHKAGAQPVFTIEPGYPAPLAFLDDAPPMLYVKGDARLLNRPVVALVGSRDASAAGQRLARQLAGGISAAGYVVASGLARGIDAQAHLAALDGGTVAVLAGGIDVVYPPEHRSLQEVIAQRGCLLTEQPPGFVPRAQDFPRRNRILSGISLAVVVVEATRRSGSLITARFAGEQGREVMAVPGHPLDPRAEGTNRLIKDGATLVTSAEDILQALSCPAPAPALKEPVVPEVVTEAQGEQPAADAHDRIIRALGPAPVDVNELARAADLPIRAVQVALMELALAGRIELHGAHLVSLKPPA
ncbi:MAG TPA: DNA-processing protein DprA [Hyphomicrobiaceae bacterium]|nr:DNA-processing protein DprA [Hyphomicrobiaceae bacterium]